MVTQKLTIRLDETELPEVRMVSGDVGREIQIEVYAREDSENPIDLETYSAEITIIKPDNTFIMDNFTVDKYELPENAGAVSGKGYYQIKIYTAGTHQIYTGQGPFQVDDMILSDDVIESSSIAFGDRFPEDFATKTWVDDEIAAAGIGTYVAGNVPEEETMPPLVRLQINDDIYPISHKIEEMEDADITTPVAGDVLTYDADDQKWKNEPLVIPDPTVTKTATGNPIEFTDGADAPLVKCVTAITGYQSGTGTPSPDNIRPIVAYTEGEIEVSDGDGNVTTHTTTYPSAIYRGSEDVVKGSVGPGSDGTLWIKRVFDGSVDENWSYQADNPFVIPIVDLDVTSVATGSVIPFAICNIAEIYKESGNAGAKTHIISFSTSQYLFYTKLDITSESDFRAYLSNNPLEIAYKISTPTTTPVTPTNLPIRTLSGYNHIDSSTGDMEVEYITQTYQPLVDLIEANSGKHVYSTEEKVVGTWIDGKTIYEKTYTNATEQSVSYQTWTPTVISATDIDRIVNLFTTRDADGGTYIPIVTRKENGYVEIFAAVGWTYNNITIQYTKGV